MERGPYHERHAGRPGGEENKEDEEGHGEGKVRQETETPKQRVGEH